MSLPDRLRLPLAFDAAALARDLESLGASEWIAHFVTQNYDGDWSVIPLRADARATHPIKMIYSDPTATAFVDTPMLAGRPAFRAVLASLRCETRAVRLMRLTAGSVIKEHDDGDLDAARGVARLHLPITTNVGVVFELNRRPVAMAPGELWYLRLSDPHRVANRGDTDRVHLVIDVVVNDWLNDLLARAAAAAG
ncbi:MAG TPA: aspartyl/asparaginyl beta-hydroxylase domain-containing protein [Caulobacteraceae bacterium]|nr:aspartyl/asparaginyl beta-hydroxylase domain-containing protein [Caulobacteraceae bacterium]